MHTDEDIAESARKLLRLGILLFLLGLVTGFLLPFTVNPRMALSSHLEGISNGLFLLVLGAIWHRLVIDRRLRRVAFGLAVFGTFTNWATTLAAAFWGAGAPMMPLAAADHTGSAGQELLIAIGLVSLSVSMVVVGGVVLWGLRPVDAPVQS
jgi:hydroxylaminobenzene mutase